MEFALNHMTAPRLDWRGMIALAQETGCVGIEFRNDLGRALFEGFRPELVAEEMARAGLRVLTLGQVSRFDSGGMEVLQEVAGLIALAQDLEAEAISLVPCADGSGRDYRRVLAEILPMLQEAQMIALVEPLGFAATVLQTKAQAEQAIEAVGGQHHFRLVHDTFHHALAGEAALFPAQTGMVHVSGIDGDGRTDRDRGLVSGDDRLGTVAQVAALMAAGYAGPVSMEIFAPEIQKLPHDTLVKGLRASFDLIRAGVADG
ncbi:TIM barrel protein [Sagittula salina]|uniref:TIM barrel protein n=1 Tax=Sagittula salina TaxID=2820268 RepID=A0A940MU31_9RHOB|nr:TIM barrel protein [Sagittula salina]MBP0485077.1 TIM barrel protein [Sagittula salina]